MSKKAKKTKRVAWMKKLHVELRKHSKARMPVAKISKIDETDGWGVTSASSEAGHWLRPVCTEYSIQHGRRERTG
jgi:hypothetical protein